MFPRIAAAAAVLLIVLAAPAAAGANPAVEVSVVTATNLTRLPATVTHRLTLTAGPQDEVVAMETTHGVPSAGGSALVTSPPSATGPSVAACPGKWQALHQALATSVGTISIWIPAGATAWIDLRVQLRAP